MNPTKIRDLIRNQARVPFFNKINLWAILEKTAIGVDLQMSAGLELTDHPDIFLKEGAEVEHHLGLVKRLLHTVPENVTLHFVVQSREGDPEGIQSFKETVHANGSVKDLGRKIVTAKEFFLNGKFIQKRRCTLFITTYPRSLEKIHRSSFWSLIEKSFVPVTREMHKRRLQELNAIVNNITDSLTGLSVTTRRLSNKDLALFFYSQLNPEHTHGDELPAAISRELSNGSVTARSLLSLSASDSQLNRFTLNNVHHKAVNLLFLPEAIQPGNVMAMMNELWPDTDLCLTVHTVNSEAMIEKLKKSGNVSKALSFSDFGSRYEAEQKFAELDELIRELRATSQKLFTFSLCVIFKNDDPDSLKTSATVGAKAFQEIGSSVGIVDDLNHEDLFLSTLPGHSHLNTRKHVIHTEPLSKLLPLTASWKGTAEPKMLFENPQGELVRMDLFDPALPSKHALLIGSTGSGKSFTTNYLLTHFLLESDDNHIVVIDIGGSYRKLAQLFGGEYMNVDLSEKYAFNPFPDKDAILAQGQFNEDTVAYLTLILERMIVEPGQVLTNLGESILEKAIKRAYLEVNTGEAVTLAHVRSTLGVLEGDPESRALASHFFNNLEMWTEGRYAKIFNSRNRLELNNRLIVFDLEGLSHHPRLQSVYFYVIREIIDSKLRNKRLRKMIVIDEGWRFFNDDIGSRLIENLYRTARKSNGMILSISQSPVDFLSTKAATAIISNSYVKYVLKLTKGHDLLPQFGFNQAEVGAIQNLSSVPGKFSDLFLKFNNQGSVIRIEPSPLDYWICTTNPEDSVKEESLRSHHPDWTHAQILDALAQEREK